MRTLALENSHYRYIVKATEAVWEDSPKSTFTFEGFFGGTGPFPTISVEHGDPLYKILTESSFLFITPNVPGVDPRPAWLDEEGCWVTEALGPQS
jgi:hypothetical protein